MNLPPRSRADDARPALGWVLGAAALIYLIAVYCSLRGVNFGNHPDEWRVLKAVEDSFRSGIFLQRWYEWGSLGYDIGAITAVLSYLTRGAAHDAIVQTVNLAAMEPPVGYFKQHGDFNLLVRSIDATISLLIVFPVAHLTWRLTKQLWPSILAAIVVGLSFQLNYHSRWYVGDALMMMFGFLSVYLAVVYLQSNRRFSWVWLASSAIAAAISAAAKYTGGMFLIAPALAVALKAVVQTSAQWPAIRLRVPRVAGEWAICAFAFGLTFVLLNPAVLVEPFVFVSNLKHMQQLYANGVGTNQDVTSRPENVLLSLLFTFLAAPSQYSMLSPIVLLLFCAGFWELRRNPVEGLILVLPFALFFFLLSWQKVFVARNLLPMLPFVAVVCGCGAASLLDAWPKFRYVLPALCLVFLAANGSYLWLSARQINKMTTQQELAEMRDYIAQRPATVFSIDKSVPDKDREFLGLPNARPFVDASSMGDFVAIDANAFRNLVGVERRHCSTNRPGLYTVFGPRDSTFDYYTAMIGGGRYVVMSRNTFQQVLEQKPFDGLICWPLMALRWEY